jgi:hypothetical protein
VAITGGCVRPFGLRRWFSRAALVVGLMAAASSTASAATTIKVSSVNDTLGAGPPGKCTLRDALVVADAESNPALLTRAEPGGSRASRDCESRLRGHGAPFKIVLATRAVYTLSKVDDYWFGQDGLPPISAPVTILGHDATITRDTATGARPFRFFYVSGGLSGIPPGSLTLQGLTLSDGLAKGGNSDGGGAGAGMGGAIFVQGMLALERVTLDGNVAQGGNPNVASAGDEGGGIGAGNSGGFGGPAPGAHGGTGGIGQGEVGNGGGGGGFLPGAAGESGAAGGGGGGKGGFGSSGDGGYGGNGDDENGDGGGFGQPGGAPGTGPTIPGGDGVGGGGGGGVGGGGAGGTDATGAGGGFGGGGSPATCDSGGCPGGNGGFGGGGAEGADGSGNDPGQGGYGAGNGSTNATGNDSGAGGGAGMGGAVFSLFGHVTLADSTLSGNSAIRGPGDGVVPGDGSAGDGLGGAVFNLDGSLTVSGSTIAGNLASGGSAPAGGGLFSLAFGNTITNGAATTASVSIAGSIIFANTGAQGAPDDVALRRVNGRHTNTSVSALHSPSIIGMTSAPRGTMASGSPITGNPLLGPLHSNGRSPATMQPGAGSPALGAGKRCDATDERGTRRPRRGCDLGAFEVTPAVT